MQKSVEINFEAAKNEIRVGDFVKINRWLPDPKFGDGIPNHRTDAEPRHEVARVLRVVGHHFICSVGIHEFVLRRDQIIEGNF